MTQKLNYSSSAASLFASAARTNAQQRLVEQWNQNYTLGQSVSLQRDNDDLMSTTTRSAAWLLDNGIAVIMLDGISGCYRLDRVTAKGQ